jgi:hypothetical protein
VTVTGGRRLRQTGCGIPLLTTTAAPWTAKDTVQCTQNLHLQAQVALAPIIPEGKPWGISVILLHIKTQLKKTKILL